jgi:photosystem II stability/assembly factor-like uncharacterized protein
MIAGMRIAFACAACLTFTIAAQTLPETTAPQTTPAAAAMRWRLVGPFRGGRVLAVAGVPGQPHTYYFGAAGGGVWKTTDGGIVWRPVFDAQSVQSIGALAVAGSDPNVVYAATGEADWRSDLSSGNGIYRSTDAGRSWQHLGLEATRHIARISIDPRNPDEVLVAAMGHAYDANPDRGVYRTTDGGRSWQKVLFTTPDLGAIDIVRQPSDPTVVYAALWSARRTPWSRYPPVQSAGGGIYKSQDGGASWQPLAGAGLPATISGRIGLAVGYGAASSRLYALIDAEKPGLYRSDDRGATWEVVGTDPRIISRAWYFSELAVDPRNPDIVYAPNVGLNKSSDGGRTWTPIKGAPGGDDYHALWIDPNDSNRMITGVDQGASISVDGGATWSTWYNQPTAQFYHVAVDNAFPYRIYGAQQDSGTVGIVSRGNYGAITPADWETVGGGESGYIVPDPDDPDVVYGGNTNGGLFRFVRGTGQSHDIAPRVAGDAGAQRRDATYRYTWTSPIAFSATRPRAMYFGSQYVLKSVDKGQSWTRISPDLSRHGKAAAPSGGGRLVQDLAPAEGIGVVYTIAPSQLSPGLIWVGTDDGLIHLSRDGGSTWKDVTPPELGPWSKVSLIDASPYAAGTAYAAVDRHRLDDYMPYIYRTRDFGATWMKVADGIPAGTFVRAVREDPVRKDLLFAGTEFGVYASFDAGEHWAALQRNLPRAPIHDLVVHDNDLIVATHGRSFWVLDDLSPLRQYDSQAESGAARLLKPATAVRVRRSVNTDTPLPPETPMGENPPDGAVIDYVIGADAPRDVSLEILDGNAGVVRRFTNHDPEPPADRTTQFPSYWLRTPRILSADRGMNRFVWDLRYPPPAARQPDYPIAAIPGDTPALPLGPQVVPGTYTVKLTVDGTTSTETLMVKMDPRVKTPQPALQRLLDLERQIGAALDQCTAALNEVSRRPRGAGVERLQASLTRIDDGLADLLAAVDSADEPPTASALAAYADFRRDLDARLAELK